MRDVLIPANIYLAPRACHRVAISLNEPDHLRTPLCVLCAVMFYGPTLFGWLPPRLKITALTPLAAACLRVTAPTCVFHFFSTKLPHLLQSVTHALQSLPCGFVLPFIAYFCTSSRTAWTAALYPCDRLLLLIVLSGIAVRNFFSHVGWHPRAFMSHTASFTVSWPVLSTGDAGCVPEPSLLLSDLNPLTIDRGQSH